MVVVTVALGGGVKSTTHYQHSTYEPTHLDFWVGSFPVQVKSFLCLTTRVSDSQNAAYL